MTEPTLEDLVALLDRIPHRAVRDTVIELDLPAELWRESQLYQQQVRAGAMTPEEARMADRFLRTTIFETGFAAALINRESGKSSKPGLRLLERTLGHLSDPFERRCTRMLIATFERLGSRKKIRG